MNHPGYYDEFGFYSPMPIDRAARREPDADFPTGPAIGESIPSVKLPNQRGDMVDIVERLNGRKAVLVFHGLRLVTALYDAARAVATYAP